MISVDTDGDGEDDIKIPVKYALLLAPAICAALNQVINMVQ